MSPDGSHLRSYGLILFSQLVSMLGSALGGFALGVWVFRETGSVTEFAMIAFFGSLPGLLVTPLAGVLADRWDRRRIMILSDFGAGLCSLAVVLLILAGRLQVWHIYVMVACITTLAAFQRPALSASTVLMVPRERLSRINGIAQAGMAAVDIAAPLVAGILVARIRLEGVLTVDLVTFLFAVGTLLFVRIPRPPREDEAAGRRSIWSDARAGWQCLAERRGLLGLLLLFAATNVCLGMVTVLLSPLILSFKDAQALGTVLSIAGLGMLAGGLLMSVWRGPRRRLPLIVALSVLQGVLLMIGGLRASVPWIMAAAFLFLAMDPIINTSSSVIWQVKIPPHLQGRTFATRRLVAGSALPVAYLAAGFLADRVFEPLMAANGALANSVGRLLGVGPGRGIGLLFMLLGFSLIVLTLGAYAHPRVRRLEEEIPDALPEPAPAAPAEPLTQLAAEPAG